MFYFIYLLLFNLSAAIEYERFNIRHHGEKKCLKSGLDGLMLIDCDLYDSSQQFMIMKV